jgi:hypothetical protein
MNKVPGNLADRLNRECDCAMTDLIALRRELDADLPGTHPHLFSDTPVFLDPAHAAEMQRVVTAIETVVRLPKYRQAALEHAPALANVDPPTHGVSMGFDFHIAPDGPKLIEINTNAGGAFLNAVVRGAQIECCDAANESLNTQRTRPQLEGDIVSMFENEWRLARGERPLRTIAIVDENPQAQYLYPEFKLAKSLFEARGFIAHIVDPSELTMDGDRLRARDAGIDLVYNRLTDFYFQDPKHQILRAVYERDLAVVTPHPRAHALYANKRNLALLSDAGSLELAGASRESIDVLLRGIPTTREVSGCEDSWWQARKNWFFKPHSGFGSRGTYRGDKLTRRVFTEVMKGEYIAQELTPPGERWRSAIHGKDIFKVDVRCYVYAGHIQLMAARLYQGQTTNFRTAGGGFAAVHVVGSKSWESAAMAACG